MEDGEKWQDIRSRCQQDMMRLKSALFYVDPIQETAKDFVDYIRKGSDADGVYTGNFMMDLQTWSFESITLIALDHKVGAFKVRCSSIFVSFVYFFLF